MTHLDEALQLLRQMLGPQAEFRDGQWDAIDAVANHRQRLLVVQRTGWGKSIVYFLASKLLRLAGAGPTLLISPLLSLMRNQILAAQKLGLHAFTLHSENLDEWPAVETALRQNQCDLLLVSPERLGNPQFMERLLPLIQGQIGLFVVDEAHCISDWGHDFRPDYRRIIRVLRFLPPNIPILCTTATANDRVVADIESQIARVRTLRGPLVRPSLQLYTVKLDDQAVRLAWLAHFIPQLPGHGIVYCLTIQDTRRVAEWLRRRGLAARAYHADLEGAERIETENLLLNNQVKALVATVALGMGFDKPDLGFVIHFQRPGSVVAYYQQVGRAGRALDSAFGILLSGREDDEIQDYFIRTAFPPVEVMTSVLAALQKGGALTVDELCAQLNVGFGAIDKALRLLEVDGAVRREKRGYSRTPTPWEPDVARYQQVTRHRREELAQIKSYVDHPGCLMEFLARALDDPAAAPCGRCMNCTHHGTRRAVPAALIAEAHEFLCGDSLVLEPRDRWPRPALSDLQQAFPQAVATGRSGAVVSTIPEEVQPQPGRVLCIYGDAGWGPAVTRGKYETGVFGDELVDATVRLVQQGWQPQPPPVWVTAVPSLTHPELVRNFAQRLANRLGLPFVLALRKTRVTPPQKEMLNSVQQLRNLLGAFAVVDPVPAGPVLLVDDVTDSGWTLTILSVWLRLRGSGPVYPFALAKASPRGR